ncbi:iron ABC transporter permease [Rhodococcus sp. IEGM 1408]|uniref:FecCD family ABC transporter permease n=1 Tax=Rhodococcus sp. IEGM 1408 TaxID=3082220 RepID=UPI002953174F|nr:iron ABC transporter permease [Rhodococcus sp. IEGM 1408]MDV8000936.1 iron ABC transporter permease [Rhodococcus sp. IEGM 1408]
MVVVASAILCLGLGPSGVTSDTVVPVVGFHLGLPVTPGWTPAEEAIIWEVRAPRVLLAAAVGAALAISGVALQAMVRNVLAEPYVLGISSGASTGAAGSILFGFATGAGQYALPVSAFIGALAASLLVFALARSNGRVTSVRLLLAGIAVGYALSAATSFLVFASDDPEGSRSVMFWMLGSLALARWGPLLALVLLVTLASGAFFVLSSPRLDALAMGDETALALGVRPDRTRIHLLLAVSLCTGVSVAAAGAIGFVGLVVPHLARRMVGAAHSRLLPVTALLGAALLIWADAVGRILMQPRELPIGILTALVGAPFLVMLVRRATTRPS